MDDIFADLYNYYKTLPPSIYELTPKQFGERYIGSSVQRKRSIKRKRRLKKK